jgi:hypothetical protein
LASGVLSLVLAALVLRQSAAGHPISPTGTLAIFVYLLLLAFLISCASGWFLEYKRGSDLETQLFAERNTRPNVTTIVEANGKDWFLVVRNSGADATFETQVHIVQVNDFVGGWSGGTFQGCWEYADTTGVEILPGHQRRLHIGAVTLDAEGQPGEVFFYFFNPMTGQREELSQRILRGGSFTMNPFLILEVVISSKPPLLGGERIRKYRLNEGGLQLAPGESD